MEFGFYWPSILVLADMERTQNGHRPDMEWIQTRHKCTQKRNRTEKNRHRRDKEETRKKRGREMKYKQIKQGADTEWT